MAKKIDFWIADNGKDTIIGHGKHTGGIHRGTGFHVEDKMKQLKSFITRNKKFKIENYQFKKKPNLVPFELEELSKYKEQAEKSWNAYSDLLSKASLHIYTEDQTQPDITIPFLDLPKKKPIVVQGMVIAYIMPNFSTNKKKNYLIEGKIAHFLWNGSLLVEIE